MAHATSKKFQNSQWYRALTLRERIATPGLAAGQTNSAGELPYRARRWREQQPFASAGYFEQRLANDGLTEARFLNLVSERPERLHNRVATTPNWLLEFHQLYDGYNRQRATAFLRRLELLENRSAQLLVITEPLIRHLRQKLRLKLAELLATYPRAPFTIDEAETLLIDDLFSRLLWMIGRTLALELNVARLEGHLQGETPAARFQSFVKILCQRKTVLDFFAEYPVLARLLIEFTNQFLAARIEFAERLCQDAEALREHFGVGELGTLTALRTGAGDSHREGRAVMILKFSGGFQIVYKPRPINVEVHTQQLFAWLNGLTTEVEGWDSHHLLFKSWKLLPREDYGWVEFVAAQGCASLSEVRRFYFRQGACMAFLYALHASDFHQENLIACGEFPVLIDLESLFHHSLVRLKADEGTDQATLHLAKSVLNIGLLPQRMWVSAQSDGLEISGLGGQAGQLTPLAVPRWVGNGTDEMRIVREQVPLGGSQNRAQLNEQEINPINYVNEIEEGFTAVYKILCAHRPTLLSADGPLAAFARDEIRAVIRPTSSYELLWQDSYHPDLLRDALDRDRYFDRLWLEAQHRPELINLIKAEQAALWRGDIPMFTTCPDSLDLLSDTGEIIPRFLDSTGFSLAQERLRLFSDDDLKRQRWFIRASMSALMLGVEEPRWPKYELKSAPSATPESLQDGAIAIGDRLLELAFFGEEEVSWVGLELLREKFWGLSALGPYLYDGMLGLSYFLAYLGHNTGETRFTQTARAALQTHRQIEKKRPSWKPEDIGAFSGLGGKIFTLSHLGIIWQEPELWQEAEGYFDVLTRLIREDKIYDIIGGAAGCLAGLFALHKCQPSARLLALARQCGDHLLQNSISLPNGAGWQSPGVKQPLAGFSHGAAGISALLMELAALTGEEKYHETALAAIAHERTLFFGKAQNWPNRSELSPDETNEESLANHCMTAWCHGAPGVGLGRLRAWPFYSEASVADEINIAVKTTLETGLGANHSICHGDLGNLDFLLQASLAFSDSSLQQRVYQLAGSLQRCIEEHGWLCGVPFGVETPGLMNGLAGIGYGLLRLSDPKRVPSLLTLSPPIA